MNFQLEELTPELFEELLPLLKVNNSETGLFKDREFSPDLETYLKLEELGTYKLFTSRVEGKVVGYCAYFITPSLHYKGLKQAMQDMTFIVPECRGLGPRFLKWCEKELMEIGIEVVYYHFNMSNSQIKNLERLGYTLTDITYCKKLRG